MKTFNSVASLKANKLKEGELVARYYYEKGDAGYAEGIVKTAAQATTDGDVIDGYIDVGLANGNVWIMSTTHGLSFAQAGAVGDKTTASADAVEAAFSKGVVIKDTGGEFRLERTITISIAYRMQGAGGGKVDSSGAQTLFYADHDTNAIFNLTANAVNEDSFFRDCTIQSSNSFPSQHAILWQGRSHKSNFENVSFQDITGYCWCFNHVTQPYGQNLSFEDCSTYNVGGVAGYTGEPAAGSDWLCITLLDIRNFNHDSTVNPVSPQRAIFDWRAIREVRGQNVLVEGGIANTDVFLMTTNGYINIDGLYTEWSGVSHDNLFRFTDDTSDSFWSDDACSVIITTLVGRGKFLFEGDTEAKVEVNDWEWYDATYEGCVQFNGDGGNLVVKRLRCKALFDTPQDQIGRATFSVTPADSTTPILSKALLQLFRWRADDGQLLAASSKTAYGLGVQLNAPTSIIEADGVYLVERFTKTGALPQIGIRVQLPTQYVGSYVTFVMRWKLTLAGSSTGIHRFVAGGNVASTSVAYINQDVVEADGYVTSVACARVLTGGDAYACTTIVAGSITGDASVSIAGADIYLGGEYRDLLDIPHS